MFPGKRRTAHFSLCLEFCIILTIFVWHEVSWSWETVLHSTLKSSENDLMKWEKVGMFALHLSLRSARFFFLWTCSFAKILHSVGNVGNSVIQWCKSMQTLVGFPGPAVWHIRFPFPTISKIITLWLNLGNIWINIW